MEDILCHKKQIIVVVPPHSQVKPPCFMGRSEDIKVAVRVRRQIEVLIMSIFLSIFAAHDSNLIKQDRGLLTRSIVNFHMNFPMCTYICTPSWEHTEFTIIDPTSSIFWYVILKNVSACLNYRSQTLIVKLSRYLFNLIILWKRILSTSAWNPSRSFL